MSVRLLRQESVKLILRPFLRKECMTKNDNAVPGCGQAVVDGAPARRRRPARSARRLARRLRNAEQQTQAIGFHHRPGRPDRVTLRFQIPGILEIPGISPADHSLVLSFPSSGFSRSQAPAWERTFSKLRFDSLKAKAPRRRVPKPELGNQFKTRASGKSTERFS